MLQGKHFWLQQNLLRLNFRAKAAAEKKIFLDVIESFEFFWRFATTFDSMTFNREARSQKDVGVEQLTVFKNAENNVNFQSCLQGKPPLTNPEFKVGVMAAKKLNFFSFDLV